MNTIKLFTFGYSKCDVILFEQVQSTLKDNAKVLNVQLRETTYLVGKRLTLADIYLTLSMVEMQQGLMDKNLKNSLQFLNSNFKNVSELPEFRSRMGAIKAGKTQILPSFEK